ncbi:MAG: hypothetical protein ACREQD_11965, partial [Candidatus Binataceae bacterium]
LIVVAGILYVGSSAEAAILTAILGASAIVAAFVLDARRLSPLIELAVRDAGAACAAGRPAHNQAAAR